MRMIKLRIAGALFFIVVFLAVVWFIWSAFKVPSQRAARIFPSPPPKHDLGRVLVVYYSASGNTAEVAQRISAMTGGTLLELRTLEPYPAAPMLFVRAKRDLNGNKYPKLETTSFDFSSYDVIFVGSPVWWSTVSLPVLSFLSESDFGGKTVVPFCTQGGGSGEFFQRFSSEAKNAKLVKGMELSRVSGIDPASLDQKIFSWLGEVEKEIEVADNI
jgi:flavodoxin